MGVCILLKNVLPIPALNYTEQFSRTRELDYGYITIASNKTKIIPNNSAEQEFKDSGGALEDRRGYYRYNYLMITEPPSLKSFIHH